MKKNFASCTVVSFLLSVPAVMSACASSVMFFLCWFFVLWETWCSRCVLDRFALSDLALYVPAVFRLNWIEFPHGPPSSKALEQRSQILWNGTPVHKAPFYCRVSSCIPSGCGSSYVTSSACYSWRSASSDIRFIFICPCVFVKYIFESFQMICVEL